MPGLLDILFGGQQPAGGGLLGYGQQAPQMPPPDMSMQPGYGQTYVNADTGGLLGRFRGALNQIANPQGLADAYQQQEAQRAGMALLNALPKPAGQPTPATPPPGGVSNFGNAIAGIESKGQENPYAALGPTTKTGDQAYGKYQVMGSNIPAWTKEHLGQEMTPQQFLANPQAQDAVFKGQFGKYLQQYGNPQDAASAWFTGKPLAQGAGLKDQLGTSGQSYVNQFNQNLGQGAPQGAGPQMAQAGPPAAPQGTAGPQTGTPATMPANGLTLVDSPALQGMPDTVRKAIPIMLASKQYAPQAMAMIQKYINPEQWQLWRDSMGNVFTRNSATGESKPLLTPTPDMMNAAASGIKTPLDYTRIQEENKVAAGNRALTTEQRNAGITAPGAGPGAILDYMRLQEQNKVAVGNTSLTEAQKNAGITAPGAGPNPITQFESDKANATELGKNFAKKYEGAVEGGVIAASTLPKLDMALDIVKKDPNFYGGIGEQYNLAIKKVATALGLPDTGVGQQLVAKTVADQTVNAIRAFAASSPVGRVLQKEVEAISVSLGSTANTKEALVPLLQIQRNVLQAMAATADIAQNHNGGSGKLDASYDRAVTDYLRTHPVIDSDLRGQIEKATRQTPATPNPYEPEMRRRGLLK